MALEPITRQEKIIAGQDLTPITRMEKFLKQFGGGGGGLPTGGAPYQQLVTDGEGNAKWEDRLCYSETKLTEIVPEETVTFSDMEGLKMALWPSSFAIVVGTTYAIKIDGTLYETTCVNQHALGNLSILGLGDDTGEPFVMGNEGQWIFASTDSADSHMISISADDTQIFKIDQKYLPIATDDSYGVVKTVEFVKSYNFTNKVEQSVMNAAIDEFVKGKAVIRWSGSLIADASRSGDDTIYVCRADSISVMDKCVATNGYYYDTLRSMEQGWGGMYLSSPSNKIFRIHVDDSGTISATEVT